jgi:glycosyltransferase 2 family protein
VVAARIVVSAAIVIFLLSQIDLVLLLATWREMFVPFFVLALALQFGGILISASKWRLLLRAAGADVSYWWAVRVYLIGQFFNNFLPTVIGGDAVRVYHAAGRTGTSLALASVFVERLTGFVALTIIGWIGLASSWDVLTRDSTIGWVALWCVMAATAALVLAIGSPALARGLARLPVPNVLGWRERLGKIAGRVADYGAYPRTLAVAMLLSFAYQLSWVATNIAVAAALRLDVPWSFMALMVPLSDIIGLIPVFFNSLGAREGVFVLLLGLFGIPAASALALSFLVFITRIAISLLGGVCNLLGTGDTAGDAIHTPQGR